ncbi:DUF58 domain-containing protein [Ahniella affigens]|uniref:DUF58 domain-containing protein n=1 Tax=Ahniella affigens TaxID=2021234 RepID=A0A2P1PST8_9GAMM|nr:DUF58 domain-containing protein [Ahniella affigens]AVP97880.1 DUF58 domain-containing protein [Ahniella affigens]
MLIPSRRLLGLILLLVLPASLAAAWWPEHASNFMIGLAGIGVLFLLDALLALSTSKPQAHRVVPHALALGVRRMVKLRIDNTSKRALSVQVFDHHPNDCQVELLPQRHRVVAKGYVETEYALKPIERGDHHFGSIELRVMSVLGFWERRVFAGAGTTIKVFPNFAALTRFALMATDHRLSQIGVLRRRRRGLGLDFQQLREYREGDAQRQIDWKATSRMNRLISREYQDERDQQIMLMIDCGRRMSARDDQLSHLDHVLNAALLLGFVGLRQGDAVGMMTIAGHDRFLAPRKSMAVINQMTSAVYDVQPTTQMPDFYSAAVSLMLRLRKRALVVIVTNLRDEDEETLLPAIRLLRKRHLILVASLREAVLGQALAAPVNHGEDAVTHAAAADYLERRAREFKRLEAAHIPCVDVPPDQLAMAMVNRYIEMKRSGRL